MSHVSPSLSKSTVSKVDSMMSIYFPEKSQRTVIQEVKHIDVKPNHIPDVLIKT